MPSAKPASSDLLRVVIFVKNKTTHADIDVEKALSILDRFEVRMRSETTEMMGRRLSQPEFTDIIGRMAATASEVGDAEVLLVASIWLATRGSHSKLTVGDLKNRVGRGTLVVSTDDPQGDGASWRYRLAADRLEIVSPTRDEMTVH